LHKSSIKISLGKELNVGYGAIIKHFGNIVPYKKKDARQNAFMEDLLMFVAKGYMVIFVVESQWLRCSGHASKSLSCVSKLKTHG